jgi:predicted Zn-dependent protease
MEEQTKGGGPEYLSTHPSHDTRISEAERIYNNSAKARHPDMRLPLAGQTAASLPMTSPKEHGPAKGPGWEIK